MDLVGGVQKGQNLICVLFEWSLVKLATVDTIFKNECLTPSKWTLCKLGYFERSNLSMNCFQSVELKVYKQKGQDLSIEVLWVSVGQRAAKLQSVSNKQTLPLKFAQNLIDQWAVLGYFGRTDIPSML